MDIAGLFSYLLDIFYSPGHHCQESSQSSIVLDRLRFHHALRVLVSTSIQYFDTSKRRHNIHTNTANRARMSMETYTLEVSEDAHANEMLAKLYDSEGLIEASERVVYEDFALSPDSENRETPSRTRETTNDVAVLNVCGVSTI